MNDDWTEFRIEGDSDDLAALKAELAKVMDPFEISEMTIHSSGQANEPLITALIINSSDGRPKLGLWSHKRLKAATMNSVPHRVQ